MKPTEPKHTPGPWFTCAQVKRPHNHALVGIGNGSTHVGYSSVTPAMSLGEAEANTRLIAAAPDLLAAADHAYRVLAQLGQERLACFAQLSAAIAKAKGQG